MRSAGKPRALALVLLLVGCGPARSTQPPPGTPTPSPTPSAASPTPSPSPSPAPRDDLADCDRGDVPACDRVAEDWGGRELAPDAGTPAAATASAAAAALRSACDQHDVASACMGLALMLRYGTAGRADRPASDGYWKRVRALGDLNGFRGEPASDAGAQALAATRAACDAGRARACNQLGWAAYTAVQQVKDLAAALAGYRRGCLAGSPQGCRWAGHFAYTYPNLGEHEHARGWLAEACRRAPAAGCDELGNYTQELSNDLAAAESMYARACAAGARAGCFHQAQLLLKRADEPDTRARALLQRACNAGEQPACDVLAHLD